ncbi:type II toxin-antitoxin system Phd/YefM family antitoxin [Allochromatium palmeri]|uniref:Antitoxin n=1 Tax=Allochromatium palmeri TaxID=231048 RepID=A0A6N8EG18_9GAMM|nr:type II toxin-antitoxin system prevent-host-death family antitoxin [Allochromatium palmeri]MTW23272.1 type II toxin-antitoxin system prevent-host-death family antitoxin [Allochromatium palmeri]
MQTQFNIHEAKTHLSRLTEQAEAGGEVVITRAGQPVVRLVRISEAPKRRALGQLEGRFRRPDEPAPPIPETPSDLMASFDGRGNIADQLAMPAGDEIDVWTLDKNTLLPSAQ